MQGAGAVLILAGICFMKGKLLWGVVGIWPYAGNQPDDIAFLAPLSLGEPFGAINVQPDGDDLLLFVSSGMGSLERGARIAEQLAARGLETWHVDLAESLFLPRGVSTLRGLDGRYVAGLIEQAHARSGKRVTLVGEVVAREVTAEEADHYAEDLGTDAPPVIQGEVYEIVASAVRVPRG